jgi:hypothetical protein
MSAADPPTDSAESRRWAQTGRKEMVRFWAIGTPERTFVLDPRHAAKAVQSVIEFPDSGLLHEPTVKFNVRLAHPSG